MTADRLGDNRTQLPRSDEELTQNLQSLSHTIRASFNDYAFLVFTGGDMQRRITIPSLEDIITMFGLERGTSWRLQGIAKGYSYDYKRLHHDVSGTQQEIEGFDDNNNKVFRGSFYKDATSDEPGISSSESWHRSFYGTLSSIVITGYLPGESGPIGLGSLMYVEPLEAGNDIDNITYTDSKRVRYSVSYNGKMVQKSSRLSYYDGVGMNMDYHIPFFQRGKDALIKSEVQKGYNLRMGSLQEAFEEPQDLDLQTFIKVSDKSDDIFGDLKGALGLNKLSSEHDPINILRLVELAQYLESRYRLEKGVSEILYGDYQLRIGALTRSLWRLFTGFDPNWESPKYSKAGHTCLLDSGIGSLPKTSHLYGIMDDYGGLSDPRGYIGPDPRGPDPRGPR